VDSLIADKIYNHDNLSACIGELISATSQLLQKDRMVIPMHEFIDVSGVKVVEMSVAAASALHWYILVQKQTIHQKINIESVKFACQSRLSIVHKYFLQGVPIKQIDRPIFQHYFGPEVDTYEVIKGEEWNQVLLENNVAFIADASFDGARFYLYWSNV
jgi:type VI secretion system protein ImpJ